MNKALVESQVWGRDEILARAATLTEKIIAIWPAPLADVRTEEDGFDWSRVLIAIEAIPPGRWTSYGELAELAGTSAQAVGGFVGNLRDESNAYRVLTSDGTLNPGRFPSTDPADTRDVRAVLEAEGVVFEGDRASANQRLGVEELAALIETSDDEADEETLLQPLQVGE